MFSYVKFLYFFSRGCLHIKTLKTLIEKKTRKNYMEICIIKGSATDTIIRQKGVQMNTTKLLDTVTDTMELNRLNGILPEGQEGQFLIAAALFGIEEELKQRRLWQEENTDTIIESLQCIAWDIDKISDIKGKEHDSVFRY